MKKNIVKTILMALLILPLAITLPAGAATPVTPPNWNVTGTYQLLVSGTYAHDIVITTQNSDGTFSGNGGYPAGNSPYTADGQTSEIITGQVTGDTITLTTTYAGALNPGYSLTISGTIAADGSMSGTSPLEWHTTSGNAILLGTLSAEDFGIVNYNTGLGQLRGYTAGFGLTDATFAGVQSVVVQLFSGDTLLQTNTATSKVGTDITGAQISSPFDVSGTFDYATDGYWTNVKESEYGQSVAVTKVVATVTLANGKVVTAENTNLSGDPATIFPAITAPVDLLSAGNFTILSETGITNTESHTSSITGDVGSGAISATAMNTVFCSEITGTIRGIDAAYVGSGDQTCFAGNPPLANKTLVDNAVLDMQTAYADAAGRTNPTATELGAGNIGGMTITAGLYKWSTDVTIPTNITLSGSASDVWIFQIAGNLDIASGGSVADGVKVLLTGDAKASNVFWQVGGVTGATLGTYSTFNGNILSAKQIIIQTGVVLNGRALAQTQVTLDASTVSIPTPMPKVTIEKYIDGIKATSQSAQNFDFPMSATWNAQNIGAGSGQFNLSAGGFNGDPTPYQAVTSNMTQGADYSTNEITGGLAVGASCDSGQPYALVGYSIGDTLLQAEQATVTTNIPSLTDILSDKFIIVQNITCPIQSSTSTGGIGGNVILTNGVLKVDSITVAKSTSTADGTFDGGWKYIFHFTMPNNELKLAMKFADWTNEAGTNTIPVANNIRISSAQADNGGAAIILTAANNYSTPSLNMVTDLNPGISGRQVEVVVEVSIPVNTAADSYTTAYGVQTTQ